MKSNKIYTARDIEKLLESRFCPPAYAFLPQVRNGTGYSRVTRTADALAMSLWPSRGIHLNGFEIKAHRGDWLNELRNPAKAEAIAQYCDFFWVVAPIEVAKVEEIPANWGLLVPSGASVKIVKQAKQLKSKAIDKLFLAAILRKAQEVITPSQELFDCKQKGIKEGKEYAERSFKNEKEEHESFKKIVKDFEEKSGVKIKYWDIGNISEAVKMVVDGEHLEAKKDLKRLLIQSKEITERIENVLNKEKE